MPPHITRWTQDLCALAPGAGARTVTDAGTRLLAAWAGPGRPYHSTQHLVEMLRALEELQEAAEIDARGARTARVAAWFHDAVYDPTAGPGRNEQDSADLARRELTDLGVEPGVVDEVERLVLLTTEHHAAADDRLGQVLCDADLWILAAPPERYREYTAQVRQEYAHVPEDAFRAGRARVLERLGAGELYATEHARRAWGSAARENLARELAALR
ncbi:Predicted metal-dependent phosphohydrolase, HD superfamily [Kytococcus aerolatus]|uniref:Predicted metal-dependent phosphohydrolase, HD superfamily n=1 Tax=Kytococcus aerolatus TaxID=592308 RepID=A0A212TBE5_9MICO|nr:hypothetical protein [Kytococcus aerolatus]SNC63180.1 Predicted metal-dependent phosphohydrolase, HD superfamily [Kytococcus aerolatus]